MPTHYEVTLLRIAGDPRPEADRLPPYLGTLVVEKRDGRRVARLIPRFDSPHAGAPAYLLDPRVLIFNEDKLVLDGVEVGWSDKGQHAIERRQTWGCRRVG
jgi:hypothetical protein